MRRTEPSTATACCLHACSTPPCTGSTAIFLNVVAAMGGPWALPRWFDEHDNVIARRAPDRLAREAGIGRSAARWYDPSSFQGDHDGRSETRPEPAGLDGEARQPLYFERR